MASPLNNNTDQGCSTISNMSHPIGALDFVVFTGLELLGLLAVLGNLALIIVLLKNKYLNRASFNLMLSLAIADVLHGIVTSTFFYPPVILKYSPISEMGVRLYNIIDWTAWAVTLTHMSAICLDRLVAIMLYGRYNQLVTVQRIKRFCVVVWIAFLTSNCVLFTFNFCCLTRPLAEHNYYTFGYPTYNPPRINMYTLLYTPVEILTIAILSISNPITLVQLYRRHKRKVALRMQGSSKTSVGAGLMGGSQRSQWQRASTMLLEMSMKMGSKHITHDVRDLATRRANRQQQRILVQISVVALIFYAYMTAYYISYYVTALQSTATMIFNSFFYSTTHMINPVIYFSLNKEMREQLIDAIRGYFHVITCRPKPPLPSRSNTHREHTIDRVQPSCNTYSETIPFFSNSTCNNYKAANNLNARDREAAEKLLNDDISNENIMQDKISEEEEEDQIESSTLMESVTAKADSWTDDGDLLNKMDDRERSEFMNDLISALNCNSEQTNRRKSIERFQQKFSPSHNAIRKGILKPSASLDIPRGMSGKFIRVSNTLQVISKTRRDDSINALSTSSSSAFEGNSKDNKMNDRRSESSSSSKESRFRSSKYTTTPRLRSAPIPRPIPSSSSNHSTSSTPASSFSDHSWRRMEPSTDSVSLIAHEFVDSSDNEDEEISYL